MSRRLPAEIEWAAQLRNELLAYRLKFDHAPAAERGQDYRGLIQNALKSLRENDPRADTGAYLRALEEFFPLWQNQASVSQSPSSQSPPRDLTPEELVERLIEKAGSMEAHQKATLANRLGKVFSIAPPSPPPRAAPAPSPTSTRLEEGPALQLVRQKFGVAPKAEIDPEMVLASLLALAEMLDDLLLTARTTLTGMNPIVENRLNGEKISSRLGPYLTTDWRLNMARLGEKLERNPEGPATVTIDFAGMWDKLKSVVSESKTEPATLLEVLRGIIELQLPHPSMVVAMLQGGMVDGPNRFAQESFHLFHWRHIEEDVKATYTPPPWSILRDADGREFWSRYKEIIGDNYTRASLSTKVTEALVSGTQRDPFCPPALRGNEPT